MPDDAPKGIGETIKQQAATMLASMETDAERARRERILDQPSGGLLRTYEGPGQVLGNLMQTGLGAGLLTSYAPVLRSKLGIGNVWHGTQGELLPSIIDKGLSLDYAGLQKRLNSYMMRDAIQDFVQERTGGKWDPAAFKRIKEIYAETTGNLPKALSRAGAEEAIRLGAGGSVDDISKGIYDHLATRGRRVYFGRAPHTVIDWSRIGNEGAIAHQRAIEALQGGRRGAAAKKTLFGVADALLGGIPSNVKDYYRQLKYYLMSRGVPAESMSNVQLQEFMKANAKKFPRAVLGIGAPALRNMTAFADFPVIGPVLGANRGFQNLLEDYMANYDPGRDLSVGHSVDPKAIRKAHLFDPKGKLTKIINISDEAAKGAAPKAVSESLLRRTKNWAVPGILSALGADLVSRGLTGRGLYSHLKNLMTSKEKQSALFSEATKRGLRGGLKGVGYVSPIMAGTALYPVFAGDTPLETIGGIQTAGLGGMPGAFALGPLMAKDMASGGGLPAIGARFVGSQAGNFMSAGGQQSAVKGIGAQLQGKYADPLTAMIPSHSLDNYMAKNPGKSGAATTLLWTAMLGGGAGYALNKYYPMMSQSAGEVVHPLLKSMPKGKMVLPAAMVLGGSILGALLGKKLIRTAGSGLQERIEKIKAKKMEEIEARLPLKSVEEASRV